jgi:6-pyruvoyltetrahydropterin/6-carboxytetrahydropterin synthase
MRNWVLDFGNFKYLKKRIEETFDHKTLIAGDDPMLSVFRVAEDMKILDLVVMENVGCEMFAEHVFGLVQSWLETLGDNRVKLVSVTVAEHGANSATYIGA